MRPKYTDDMNCQFMWPVKSKSVVWLAKPAVCTNTRKMQSYPKKRIKMQSTKMNDSRFEEVQSQCRQEKPKKMQPVMQPVRS